MNCRWSCIDLLHSYEFSGVDQHRATAASFSSVKRDSAPTETTFYWLTKQETHSWCTAYVFHENCVRGSHWHGHCSHKLQSVCIVMLSGTCSFVISLNGTFYVVDTFPLFIVNNWKKVMFVLQKYINSLLTLAYLKIIFLYCIPYH